MKSIWDSSRAGSARVGQLVIICVVTMLAGPEVARASISHDAAEEFIAGPMPQSTSNMWQYVYGNQQLSQFTLLPIWDPTGNASNPGVGQWDDNRGSNNDYPHVMKTPPEGIGVHPGNVLIIHPGDHRPDTNTPVAVAWRNNTGATVSLAYEATWRLDRQSTGIMYFVQRGLYGSARYLSIESGSLLGGNGVEFSAAQAGIDLRPGELLYVGANHAGNFYWDFTQLDLVVTVEPVFTDIAAVLIGVYDSSVAWGDYDNDGDLDILLTGCDSEDNQVAKVYENTDGSFSDIGAGLTGVRGSSIAWGDYDNDSDLDILLTGYDGSNRVAKVYTNAGGVFTDIGAELTGVSSSSVAWGDYDNDGDLDILLSGYAASGPVTKVYLNTVGVFSDIGAGLTGVGYSSVAWGDYDNDGDLDILLTGYASSGRVAKVYANTGGAFFDIGAGLTGVDNSSVAWGDYDNDGDLDILLSGVDSETYPVAKVYANTDGTFSDIGALLTRVGYSSVAWGDHDNDGDLDILLTGIDSSWTQVTKVCANNDGTFSDIGAMLDGVFGSSVAWGDYDNDGDLDILLTGQDSGRNRVSKVYENPIQTPNNLPTAPLNLAAAWFAGTVTFSWDAATDTETPQPGLSYNLRVGTTPGGSEITSAMACTDTGYRRIPDLGNANHNMSWTVAAPSGQLYWSVQAIDGAWAGSSFAPEQMAAPFLDIGAGLTGVDNSSVAWGDYDNDGDLDILLTGLAFPEYMAKVYANTDGTFSDIGAGLTGVAHSSVAWGDYDNDGDLDILLSGRDGNHRMAKVYANTGGAFFDIGAGLTGVDNSSVAWGDYDNDGDLDILLTGFAYPGWVAMVYANTDGTFSDIGAGLTGVGSSSVAWGDYDNDGDLDILLAGWDGESSVAKIYANTDGTFSDIGAGLTGVHSSSVAWGDYDNDGDLDILLTGNVFPGWVAKVYANTDGTFSDIGAGLTGVGYSSVAWGDYDNDGDLDILLSGLEGGFPATKLYANTDGNFSDIGAGLIGVIESSVAWGDYDNDSDLDILLTGWDGDNYIANVYENPTPTPNTPPTAPGNLAATWSAGTVTFNWDAATDTETPQSGLSYNLRVGTTPGGSEICSAHANPATGLRLVPRLGSFQQMTTWDLEIPSGVVCFWSVQALDATFAGSAFAVEQTYDTVTGVADLTLPTTFVLRGNIPNPFNPVTTIAYDLPQPESVCLRIFDISGRRVHTLMEGRQVPAGRHQVIWDGRDDMGRTVSAGIYLYRLEAGSFSETRRMMLVK